MLQYPFIHAMINKDHFKEKKQATKKLSINYKADYFEGACIGVICK